MEVSLLRKLERIPALVGLRERPRHKNYASGTSLELACGTEVQGLGSHPGKNGQDPCTCAVL